MNDPALDQLLKNCDPLMKVHPGFQREVWMRIESAESRAWIPAIRRLCERIGKCLTLPPVAAATCAAAVLAGIVLGGIAEKSGSRDGSAYLRAISPFIQATSR